MSDTVAYAMWQPASHPSSELDQRHQSTWLERNSPTGDIPEALLGTGRFCGGVIRDYKGRLPHALSDFTDGVSWKTLSAALFMFCATVASTVALGDVAYRETDGMVGITEYLMLQGVAGAIHSLFSACPLPILRPTGPITAFMVDLYQLSSWVGVGYYSLLSWVGFWVGIFLILIALFDLSRYIALCTRFLHDIYAVFVCTIYITDGIIGVRQRFEKVSYDIKLIYSRRVLMRLALLLHPFQLDAPRAIFSHSHNQSFLNFHAPIGRVGTGFLRWLPRPVLHHLLARLLLYRSVRDFEATVAVHHLRLRCPTCCRHLYRNKLRSQG